MRHAALLTALEILACFGALAPGTPLRAQRSPQNRPGILQNLQARRARAHAVRQARLAASDPVALDLLKKSFLPGADYTGVQRTEAGGEVSEQKLEGDQKGRIRRDYLSPAAFAGDIMLILPNAFYEYHAHSHRADIALWPVGREEKQKGLLALIRQGKLTVTQTGMEQIAGYNCAIVAVAVERPGNAQAETQRKFWIEPQTGIVMRLERWNARGQISASYMTSINIGPEAEVNPTDFLPRSLPRSAVNEPLFPDGKPPYQTVEEAQVRVPFTILLPRQVEEGYGLNGVWVFPAGTRGINTSVLLRYTRGVNHFSLFERRILTPRSRPIVARRLHGSLLHWQTVNAAGDTIDVIYIGQLVDDEATMLRDSLR